MPQMFSLELQNQRLVPIQFELLKGQLNVVAFNVQFYLSKSTSIQILKG